MKLRLSLALWAPACLGIVHTPTAKAVIISKWDFSSATLAANNSPAPSTGAGTAISLGMTNTYSYAATTATNSVTSDDILSSVGAPSGTTENTWRIKGAYVATGTAPNVGTPTKSSNVNGWNLSAPQYSQGAEFDVSTVGYTAITASFDWFSTNQGVRDLQEQYSLDTTNSAGWTNINSLQVATPNDFNPNLTIDLSAITGAANDPNFGLRFVSAYDPTYTGTGAPTYTSATLTSGAPVQYNNSSGNWRFDNISVSGTAVPEPATASILTVGIVGLLARRRRTV